MKLTDKALKNFKAGTVKKNELTDGFGLSAKLNKGGSISFQYRYVFEGRSRRHIYGQYPVLSLKEARIAHFEARKLKDQGIDPGQLKQEQRRNSLDAVTVSDLIKEFDTKYVKTNHRSDHAHRILYSDIEPNLGKYNISSVKRRDIVKMLDAIVERGSRIQANRTASVVKLLFQYAVERGLAESNPASDITRRSVGGTEVSRSRVLSDDEIKTFWLSAPTSHMSRRTLLALRLLLVTAQRRGELLKSVKTDFDLQKGIWTIPAVNSKNGRAHSVPLSPLAEHLVRALINISDKNEVQLLPSPCGNSYMTGRAISRAVLRSQGEINIEQWTPHDLRRTAATGMAGMDVPPYVVEKVLNHSMQGVMAVYNRYDYMMERRSALDKWSEHILGIIRNAKN